MTVRLAKLHGAGNDFLVLDGVTATAPRSWAPSSIAALCDRHRGIGADGIIVMEPGEAGADCTMVLHNADGSPAEISGNGLRCLASVAVRAGLGDGKRPVSYTHLTLPTNREV